MNAHPLLDPVLKKRILAAAAARPSLTRREARRLVVALRSGAVVLALLVLELLGGARSAVAWTCSLVTLMITSPPLMTWLSLKGGSARRVLRE